jgi:uncharacterized membrane protein YbhN (UPF0104 family)
MDRTSRRLVIVVVAVAALGYFFYKFRNSITLEGFHWSTVWESLRDANLGLLLLALVVIYGCFAIRAIRWNWLSRTFGTTISGRPTARRSPDLPAPFCWAAPASRFVRC